MLAIFGQATLDLSQAITAAYYAWSPITAQGVGLSSQVKINGLRRLVPSRSTATVQLIGQAATRIPAGAIRDPFGNLWDLPPNLVIPASGELWALARAREAGQILAGPNTLTTIATAVMGWQTVTNPLPADPGQPFESDGRLRLRQHRSTAKPAITPIGAIYAELANIVGTGRVEIYENDKDFINDLGIPGHSIACVVEGGDATEIATAISLKKSPGCGTYGTTSLDVEDGAAQPNTINWFYVTHSEVLVQIELTPLQGFVSSTSDLIRQAVAFFINEQRLGWPIYRAWLAAPASLAGEAAETATGLDAFQLERLSETYVLNRIWLGTSAAEMGTKDVTPHFAEAMQTMASDVAIVLRQ